MSTSITGSRIQRKLQLLVRSSVRRLAHGKHERGLG